MEQARDLKLIFDKYQDKATKGNGYAMLYIADCYLYGWGVERNYEQYRNCLNQAAILGADNAYERMFYEALSKGNSGETEKILDSWINKKIIGTSEISNNIKTKEIYDSLDGKSVQGMIDVFEKSRFPEDWEPTLALLYQFGYGVERNATKSVEMLKKVIGDESYFTNLIATILGMLDVGAISEDLIDDKLFDAMCNVVATDTYDSPNINKNAGYNERVMIYASCQGKTSSMIEMAKLYEDSEDYGIMHPNEYGDNKEASRWLIEALNHGADTNDTLELLLIASEFAEENDLDAAFKSFYAMAQGGNAIAQTKVGSYYFNGWGVTLDVREAGKWFRKAAEQGEEEAIEKVKIILEAGNGDYEAGINTIIEEDKRNNVGSDQNDKPKSSGGCYVATCVYGSYDCPEVWTLRRFRDYKLSKTWYGRLFIRGYYAISPTVVRVFGKYKCIKQLWRIPLDRLVKHLGEEGYKSTPYGDNDELH